LQGRIPVLVGGSGERKTLRLVARYADACNLVGDAATVAHKLAVLRGHCDDAGRDPADIRVTHLGSVRLTDDPGAEFSAAVTVAGTVEDHAGRFRELAEAGVQTAIVSLQDLDVGAVERFAPVIDAFR
jgi:alkanesulfonate monooxygenase SsuD/methylene tetrahydromethanopterin reductase-like flavin-dependent oxidoreductase (luciferase family)